MDAETLNRLMAQITYEIHDFLPANLFHPISFTVKINDRNLSEEQARGVIVSGLAENLFYAPPSDKFMSLRQRDACELLMHTGHLIGIDPADPKQPQVAADFYASLKKYFDHMAEQEAKPFVSLFATDPAQLEPQNEAGGSRHNQQEEEILRIIRALGHDPKKLPPFIQGKPWVKSAVRKELNIPRQPFQSNVVFNKAWERLRNNRQIK